MLGFDQQTQPAPADIAFKSMAPPGTYNFLCFAHPGMTGTVTVVDPATAISTQAQLDAAAAYYAASLTYARDIGDTTNVIYTLGRLSILAMEKGDLLGAQAYIEGLSFIHL